MLLDAATGLKACCNRTCPFMGKGQLPSEFCSNRSTKDGLNSSCRTCVRLNARKPHNRAEQTRRGRERIKDWAIEAYGGICLCCDEVDTRLLTIDHVDGVDPSWPKHARGGNGLYSWLKRLEYPEGFQTLCFNCNSGRACSRGTCPHVEPYVPQTRGERYTRKLKQEMVLAYGNGSCACCGESTLDFLTLDHVVPLGNKPEKVFKGRSNGYGNRLTGRSAYFYLRRLGWPNKRDYQVLCWNCNSGRACNGGVCPHQEAA